MPKEKDLTIKDLVKKAKFPYRIKVYKVKVSGASTTNIWYASKIGCEFYCVLAIKTCYEGFVPIFRTVDYSIERNIVNDPAIFKDIHSCDCNIVEEFILKTSRSLRHLVVSNA